MDLCSTSYWMLLQRGLWIYARHVTGFCYRGGRGFNHDTLLAVVKLKAQSVCVCEACLPVVVVTDRECLCV